MDLAEHTGRRDTLNEWDREPRSLFTANEWAEEQNHRWSVEAELDAERRTERFFEEHF